MSNVETTQINDDTLVTTDHYVIRTSPKRVRVWRRFSYFKKLIFDSSKGVKK